MKMKLTKFKIGILRITFLISMSLSIAQENEYGSNNGEYVEVNDVKLYYETYGSGTPLILLHGGLGSISNFKSVIPELAKHFKVIAIDSPGHGRSEQMDSLSYTLMSEHIAMFIDKLEISNINIMGYSDGAITGLLIAHLRPNKVSKLVFGAGALGPDASTPEGIEMLKNFRADMLPPDWEENYKKKSPNPDYWDQFILDSKEMWLEKIWIPHEILPDLKCKVLVLFGDRDQFIPLEHALEIYKLIPKSELSILPNMPHEMFNFPYVTNPVVINFLLRE